jgi:acyl carrier protein
MSPLQEKLVEIAREVNANASLRDEADLDLKFGEIGIDSLEAMAIMLVAMERFAVKIPDEEVDGIVTINELARLIESRVPGAGSST